MAALCRQVSGSAFDIATNLPSAHAKRKGGSKFDADHCRPNHRGYIGAIIVGLPAGLQDVCIANSSLKDCANNGG